MRMPETGVHIQYGHNISGRPLCWSLYLVREATKEDLEENHHLEEIGESIWSVRHEISYCPHCGARLMLIANIDLNKLHDQESTKRHGSFSLFDQQQWHGKLR